MTSQNYWQKKASISLRIREVGHVPAYKNSKLKTKRGSITNPVYQKQMEIIIRNFESQLLSDYRTAVRETGTELSLQSWIASSLPEKDCLAWIPEGAWAAEYVERGQEGADITIEEI